MTDYGKVRSFTRPQDIEITDDAVYLAKNITPYEEEKDGRTIRGYEYDYIGYSKDEYTIYQDQKIASLESELAAAKILLGVD